LALRTKVGLFVWILLAALAGAFLIR